MSKTKCDQPADQANPDKKFKCKRCGNTSNKESRLCKPFKKKKD